MEHCHRNFGLKFIVSISGAINFSCFQVSGHEFNFQRAAMKTCVFHSHLEIDFMDEYSPLFPLRKRHKAFSNSEAIAGFNRVCAQKEGPPGLHQDHQESIQERPLVILGHQVSERHSILSIALWSSCCRFWCHNFLQKPTGSEKDDVPIDALNLFSVSEWKDLWPEAKVLEACIYLRGGIHLNASRRWKSVFPTEIPMP